MTYSGSLFNAIKDTEYVLAKYKAIQKIFPDAKTNYYMEFTDKSVNQKYSKFIFQKSYNGLYVMPYFEMPFIYNNKEEIIKIHSSPKRNKLVYITWRLDPASKKKIMKFSRLSINMKNNNFSSQMLNSCKAEIMSFIKNNPGYHLDTKHLDTRLKKLLLFT